MAMETETEEVRVVFVDNPAVVEKVSPGSGDNEHAPGPTQTGLPQHGDRLPLASLGFRATAWLIDLLVVLLIVNVARVTSLPFAHRLVFVFIAYHASLVWLTGKTVGKALFGLRVNRSSKKVGVVWALGRASLGYFVVDLFGLGLVSAFFNPQRRCLHDLAFRSDVVFEGDHKLRVKALLSRLIEFAQLHQSALEERKRPFTVLKGLWEFLMGLARWLEKGIDLLRHLGRATSDLSMATLPFKAAVAVMTVTTATTVGTVVSVPPARAAVERFATPITAPITTAVSQLTRPAGPAGSPGTQGQKGQGGSAGSMGTQGQKGQVGAAGSTGTQGQKGEGGAAGTTGIQGQKGEAGAAGSTGTQGQKGEGGAAGTTGTQGPKGEAGPAGPPGATGPQGPIGPPGPAGQPGPAGLSSGLSAHRSTGPSNAPVGPAFTTVVTQAVPAGFYVFIGKTTITTNTSTGSDCLLTYDLGNGEVEADRSNQSPFNSSVTARTAHNLQRLLQFGSSGATIRLKCRAGGTWSASDSSVVAVKVQTATDVEVAG